MTRMLKLLPLIVLLAACGATGAEDEPQTPTSAPAAGNEAQATTTEVAPAPSTTMAVETPSTTMHDMEMESHEDDSHDETTTTGAAEPPEGVDEIIVVDMVEFAFEPETLSIEIGSTVRFDVSNSGLIEHEFRLSNTHRINEHLASGHEDHGDDGHHESGDHVLTVGPGESGSLTVTFDSEPSEFTQFACLIPGHYEAGMWGDISY